MKKNVHSATPANRTELVFILDRSGSMAGLEADTIGGFNSLIAKQKKETGECRLTTVLFDDKYEMLHNRVNLKEVSPITGQEYWVRGSTALLDAIGRTIHQVGRAQKYAPPQHRADKVLFVITTDGMENASREYSCEQVREMICRQKEKYGWEFLFLGANIDAIETASRFGISASRAVNYHADSQGTQVNYQAVSEAVSCMRACGSISDDWSAPIQEDYDSRGGNGNARRNHW